MIEQRVLSLRLTPAEVGLLDWLQRRLQSGSRAETIRQGLLALARYHGASPILLHNVHDERAEVRERRVIDDAEEGCSPPIAKSDVPFIQD